MTTYTYLGYGTTDSNGVAKLDHDANGDAIDHSYTGTGAGEIDVVASVDKPIASGSVVSTTYEVLDAIFYITGTTDTGNWQYNTSNTSLSYSDDGTHIAGGGYCTLKVNNSTHYFDGTNDLCFEFDIKPAHTTQLRYVNKDNGEGAICNISSSTEFVHVKLVYSASNNKITPYINGTQGTDASTSNTATIGMNIQDWSNTLDVYVKNLRVYPI